MTNNNQDIVDALRYRVNISLNGLRQAMRQCSLDTDKISKAFKDFASKFGYNFIPYHKTKEFRRRMYYRRYERNSHRSKKGRR